MRPGTTLPPRVKFKDRYDPCPYPLKLEHYYHALIRTQAQLAGAAEIGALGVVPDVAWGGAPIDGGGPHRSTAAAHGWFYGPLPWASPLGLAWVLVVRLLYAFWVSRPGRFLARRICAWYAGRGLAFARRAGLFRSLRLEAWCATMIRAAGHVPALLPHLLLAPSLQVFAHANFQVDNARFVQGDAPTELVVSPFDFGNAGFMAAPLAFGGMLGGITVETFHKHEDAFFRGFSRELERCSGRAIDPTEVRDCFRASDATLGAAACCYFVGTDVVACSSDDFANVEHVLHPKIQTHWNTKCWVINLVERVYAHDMRPDEGLDAARRLARREATAILGRTLAGILLA